MFVAFVLASCSTSPAPQTAQPSPTPAKGFVVSAERKNASLVEIKALVSKMNAIIDKKAFSEWLPYLDDAADHLPAWLRERDLRLEVALGGRYAMDNNYNTLPMTLFVDRSGAVVFTKDAATEQLVEELTWRIDALRAPRPGG